MPRVLVDSNQSTTGSGGFPVQDLGAASQRCGTVFTASETHVLTEIEIKGDETNSCPGLAQIEIFTASADKPSGSALDTATITASTFPPAGSATYMSFTMTGGVTLTSGNKYCIVLSALSANPPGTGYLRFYYSNDAIVGGLVFSNDLGSSWDNTTWFATLDCNFKTYKNVATYAEGTKSVTSTWTITPAPSKATTPTPTDSQGNILITGVNQLKQLVWVAPGGETPDYQVYFRAQGGAWQLQETITDNSLSHTLSSALLAAFNYYSIYEWKIDTRQADTGWITEGDTWTFISQQDGNWSQYNRRSDYNANQVWQPGTGWVNINTFAYTGGGRFKGRIMAIGHKVIYFGDI